MPTKVWQPGEAVVAAEFNPLVQAQVVATFANAAERDAELPTPSLGMHCYLADTKALLQYTDAPGVARWHRPWSEPWGLTQMKEIPDFRFGGWTGIPGTDLYFSPGQRNRLVRVAFNTSIYKDIDGGDAHTVIRMNGLSGASWVPIYDALVTVHQGWVGRPYCTLVIDTQGWSGVWFHALCTYGTAVIQWTRITIEDVGPTGAVYTP